ncbi:hypothetical protein VE01_05905 [Pseudogymnoascus verrucosus]|uniref:Carboxylic ester hydrolase n=1 Tax=Pseudogymnoascus verrucosus TaxID=342668 RepID=A0A1B8GIB8_9PEZI|nr:uncharacterized protein VE01_05905 [Pseudogymnoascus verrucosus]OBT95564.2 hypothetical protein VE01_05905 [Pseudogymnoascus verrucosus]
MTFLKASALLSVARLAACAAPNLPALGSDVTILSNNDLYSSHTTRTTGALLVNTAFCQKDAAARCTSFAETLWDPSAEDFNLGLDRSLAYQVYQGNYGKSQLFWVASDRKACQAIDAKGKTKLVSCSQKLPALCTQSAPIPNATFTDTSARFQVAQKVGKQTLTGYRDFYNWRFFGVRFAPQPERFSYSTVYDGEGSAESLESGTECVQAPGVGSEDCLFLNVWTPYLPSQKTAPATKKLKAVMFYMVGGGFVGGSASVDDLGNMASRGDVVVISINYRMANLGFLALDDGVTNGNYGIQDAITALEWVKRNVKAFGGDPSRITVFGSSAGASLVRALLASPKAKGLFEAGIMQSNPAGALANGPYSELQSIQQVSSTVGAAVLNETSCSEAADKLACLRAYDPIELNNLAAVANYPVVDGTYLTTPRLEVTGGGYAAHVPVMNGGNRDELAVLGLYLPITDPTEAILGLGAALGFNTTAAAAPGIFPLPPGANTAGNIFNITSRILTDVALRCGEQAMVASAVKHGVFPKAYAFTFNRTYQPVGFGGDECRAPLTTEHPAGDANAEYYKCHAGELQFVFGNILHDGLVDRDGGDVPFAQLVVDYWTSFARTQDPNPDAGYLAARGYVQTLRQVKEFGRWRELTGDGNEVRMLQLGGRNIHYIDDGPQCASLGYPIDYYETLS